MRLPQEEERRRELEMEISYLKRNTKRLPVAGQAAMKYYYPNHHLLPIMMMKIGNPWDYGLVMRRMTMIAGFNSLCPANV